MGTFFRRLGRILVRNLEILAILLYITFEELVWQQFVRPVRRALERIVRPATEAWLLRRHRYTLLALFSVMLAAAEGLGIVAGIAFVVVHPLVGIALYLLKILAAGLAFWMLSVAKPKLMSIPWFQKAYRTTALWIRWVQTRPLYLQVKRKAALTKEKIRAYLARRSGGTLRRAYGRLRTLFRAPRSQTFWLLSDNGEIEPVEAYRMEDVDPSRADRWPLLIKSPRLPGGEKPVDFAEINTDRLYATRELAQKALNTSQAASKASPPPPES